MCNGRMLAACFLIITLGAVYVKAIETNNVMGDWQGYVVAASGQKQPIVAQVIALGNGNYKANFLPCFDKRVNSIAVLEGELKGMEVILKSSPNDEKQWQGNIKNGKMTGTIKDKNGLENFELVRTVRLSPTLGQKPPKEAVVLFDGKNFDQWKRLTPNPNDVDMATKWKIVDGVMEIKPESGSLITKRQFRNFKLHVEFRLPYEPNERGQSRGNSGVYLHSPREAVGYEVQVLDSYGLEGLERECGAIYGIKAPLVNACAPPTQWQTYDVTFYAPLFENGKRVKNARVTLLQNGIKIQDNTEVPGPTAASADKDEDRPEPIFLQDHGHRVQYQNIWLVEIP